MRLRPLAITAAFLVLPGCVRDHSGETGSALVNQRKAVLAGLGKDYPSGKVSSFQINVLNISGDWAFVDVTPRDKTGKPLAEQKVAVLHHVHAPGGADQGWKELDLSKVPRDPNEEEYGTGFRKNVQKTFPFLPRELFR